MISDKVTVQLHVGSANLNAGLAGLVHNRVSRKGGDVPRKARGVSKIRAGLVSADGNLTTSRGPRRNSRRTQLDVDTLTAKWTGKTAEILSSSSRPFPGFVAYGADPFST